MKREMGAFALVRSSDILGNSTVAGTMVVRWSLVACSDHKDLSGKQVLERIRRYLERYCQKSASWLDMGASGNRSQLRQLQRYPSDVSSPLAFLQGHRHFSCHPCHVHHHCGAFHRIRPS